MDEDMELGSSINKSVSDDSKTNNKPPKKEI